MDYAEEYGLRCDCKKSESKPKKRTIKGGRIVYGLECQNCGRFEQKPMKSFGWYLPSEFINESLSNGFSERRNKHWQDKNQKRDDQWRDNYEAYLDSSVWAKKRSAALKRDKYVCQACLENPACHVHHLSYRRLGREPLWELVSVCIECHRNLHSHMQKELDIDWGSFNARS